jgi:hypothetical protein
LYNLGGQCNNQSTQWCRGILAGYSAAFYSTFPQSPRPTTVINDGPSKNFIVNSHNIPQRLYSPPNIFESTSPTVHSFGSPSSLERIK